jgi:DNA-binding NarL/FixJ family response regulator
MYIQSSIADIPGWGLGADQGILASVQPLRILVVEDEMLIAMGLELVVQSFGHSVCALASNADAAIAEAGRHRPDIVLMDICLGRGSSGIVAACEIRKRFDIPAIFISANLDPAMIEAAQDAKPAGFIAKPFTPDRIGRALAEIRLAAARDG